MDSKLTNPMGLFESSPNKEKPRAHVEADQEAPPLPDDATEEEEARLAGLRRAQDPSHSLNSAAYRPEKKARRKPGAKIDSEGAAPEASAAEMAMSELPNPYAEPAAHSFSPAKAPNASLNVPAASEFAAYGSTGNRAAAAVASVAEAGAANGSAPDAALSVVSGDVGPAVNKVETKAVSAREAFTAFTAMSEAEDEPSLMACPRSYIFESRLEKARQLRACGNAHFSGGRAGMALACYARAEHHAEFDEAQLFEFTDEHRQMVGRGHTTWSGVSG
jgi:hypothetical protein